MSDIKPLNADLQKVAVEELGEVPERITEDLDNLKNWIIQQPHLNARTDDQFLIQFLRGCKYSLERAKEKIDHFHALRTKYADLLKVVDVDRHIFRQINTLGCMTPLPTPLNGNGPRIVIFRFNYSVQKYKIEEVLQLFNAINEVFMVRDPYACIHGVMYVVDLAKATTSHFLQFTPMILKRFIAFYEKTIPLRIKGVCYINVSSAAEQFFKVLLPCFSEKLRERVFICGKNIDDLHKRIPLKYMPEDYGGSNGSLDNIKEEYDKIWDEYRDYFKKNAEYGTNEHLRTGKAIDFDNIFGAGGTFRKMNVD